MDLDALRAATRRRVGITSTDARAADADLLEIVQEALDLFNNETFWPWAEASTTLSLVAGTASYSVPTGWVATRQIQVPGESVLDGSHSRAELDDWYPTSSETGPPRFFVVSADLVRVYPTPDTTVSATHLYFRSETRLSAGTDTPLAPVWTHAAIVDLAASILLARVREDDRAEKFDGRYREWVRKTADNLRRSTGPVRVRVRPGGFL